MVVFAIIIIIFLLYCIIMDIIIILLWSFEKNIKNFYEFVFSKIL